MPIEWLIEDDEDVSPEHRADYIAGMIAETTYSDGDKETGVADLLGDLLHYCEREKVNFTEAFRRGFKYYRQEGGKL